jgi:hypothetical protein
MKAYRLLAVTFILTTCLLSGCAIQGYDYTALNQSKPLSILVIPPRNNSVDVNAPYTLISSVSKPLAEKGYYVFPVAVIDTLFKENGLPTTAEMNEIPLTKIREIINPDAVLYIDINQWGQEYQILSSNTVVSSDWRLIDAKTGQLLWGGRAQAVQSSSDGGGGLAGALIGALVDQIAGSMIDRTPELSQIANDGLINNRYRGLLAGPYAPKTESQN